MSTHKVPVADAALRRVLGPLDAGCIVVGAVVGVGIFFTPSRVAMVAGSGGMALAAWVVGGVIALLGALTFAELGGLYTRSAGQYEILRDAYGPFPAFLFVFCNATAIQAGATAIIAIVCAANVSVAAAGALPGPIVLATLATALILAVMIANVGGVRWGAGIQVVMVFAKVFTLLAVTCMALAFTPREESRGAQVAATSSPLGIVATLFAALVPAFFSYGGWQHILWIGGEIREPQRNVPRAIIIGMSLVVAVYVLVNWAYLRLLGHGGVANSEALAADAVSTAWHTGGRRAIAAAVALSAFGVLNAQLLSGPRLIYGMALDGRFFKPFTRVNGRFGTPVPAILLIGCMALVLLHAAGQQAVDKLLTGVVAIDGIFFALTAAAVFVLRHTRRDVPRPARVLGYPVVPLVFIMCELGVVAGAFFDPDVRRAAVIGACWIVVAAACYFLFFRDGRRSGECV